MTDGERSQAAEDVAREITRLLLKLNWINPYRGSGRPKRAMKTPELFDAVVADLLTADVFNPDGILPILARLVREGQIRCLEAEEETWLVRGDFEASFDSVDSRTAAWHAGCAAGYREAAETVHASIAALRQEG